MNDRQKRDTVMWNKRMKGEVVSVEVYWCESMYCFKKMPVPWISSGCTQVHNTDEPEIVLKCEPKPPAQKLTYRRAPCVSHQAIPELLDSQL